MANSNKPLQTGYTRVFIIAGRARGDHSPEYFSQLKMGGISQSFGDVTKIEIPDPNEYGKFIEADRIRGQVERASFSLIGRYASVVKSRLLTLSREGCPFDVQLHMGECTDPSAFNVFSKAIISEDAIITNHSTDELGALESGEGAAVNETGDISSKDYYEVLPLSFVQRGGSVITNQVNGVVVFDTASCGSCQTESNGCQKIFAVTNAAGGSPGTPPDVVYSLDGGATILAHDVDTLSSSEDASSVAGVGDYVVVISQDAASLNYADVQDFLDGIDPVFTEVTTGFVGGGEPIHIWSVGRKAFIVGAGGYVYFTDDPTSGVDVLEAGSATTSQLNFVHAIDEENAVAVGNDGVVIFTKDKDSWDVATAYPVGIGVHLTSVFMKNENEWWVTASNGTMYYTLNAGKSWTAKTLPGTTPSKMSFVGFSSDSVAYASGIVSSRGRIYRSFDGGNSWVVTPEGTGSIPAADEFISLALCTMDVNFVVGGGLGDDASDGIIVVGQA